MKQKLPAKQNPSPFMCVSTLLLLCSLIPSVSIAQSYPAPNPPVRPFQQEVARQAEQEVKAPAAAPTTEWTNHKSADGGDPEPREQSMLWFMNSARQDPTDEGIWLAESNDPDVKNGRDFFNVDLDALKSAFAATAAAAPAAFDIRLHDASELHSEDLIDRDAQDHDGQFDKVDASGFNCNGGRVSVFSFADSALNAHAALNIDWGNNPPSGMQDPPGHRFAIMGVFGSSLSNVGLAMVPENNSGTQVGPLVFSGAYCHAGGADHNRFIVGTVWQDLNMNGVYDEGEGHAGVTVMPDSGTFYAITGDAGGYAIPITSAGSYTVNFSGGGLGELNVNRNVDVGAESALLDLESSMISAEPVTTFYLPNLGGSGNEEAVAFGDRGLGEARVIDLGNANVLNTVDFTAGLQPIDAAYGTDLNGDGDVEIYALLQDPVAARPKVEARDPLTGAKRNTINYSTDHEAVALGIAGNAHEEGVVLARQTSNNDRGRLLIRNLIDKSTRVNISLPKSFRVDGLVMATDFSGNGFDEALVSAARFSDEKGFILIYDTGVAKNGRIKNIPLPTGNSVISHDYTLGPGGVSAVTVQALRASDNRPRLYMYAALTGDRLWVKGQKTTWSPVSVKAFETSGGGRRVAALMQRSTDDRPLVAIYNANTGEFLDQVLFKPGFTGVDLTIFPDTSLDSGRQPEFGVTMEDGTIRVRDSLTKDLLQTLNAP